MLHVWSLRKPNTETPSNPAPRVTCVPHSEDNSCRPLGPGRRSGTALNRSTLPLPIQSAATQANIKVASAKSRGCGSAADLSSDDSGLGDKSSSLEKRDLSQHQGPMLINTSGPGAGSGGPHLGDDAPLALHTSRNCPPEVSPVATKS